MLNEYSQHFYLAFLVELFPFAVRSRGITIFQLFGRLAGFFNQYVNPIGIQNAGWKYYLSYVIWLAFEVRIMVYIRVYHILIRYLGLVCLLHVP